MVTKTPIVRAVRAGREYFMAYSYIPTNEGRYIKSVSLGRKTLSFMHKICQNGKKSEKPRGSSG